MKRDFKNRILTSRLKIDRLFSGLKRCQNFPAKTGILARLRLAKIRAMAMYGCKNATFQGYKFISV